MSPPILSTPIPTNWRPVGPEDLEGFTDQEGILDEAAIFQDTSVIGSVASGTTGACCLSGPCSCVANQTPAQCAGLGGTFMGAKTVCAKDICGCLVRACCNPAGVCIGDQSRAVCQGAGNTWHIEASCVGAGSLPPPVCNSYNVNNCNWDNGQPFNDGGASPSHTHAGGFGQLPRYDFNTADDFILGGPDSTPCQISQVRAWLRMRPAAATVPPGGPPTPGLDLLGVNVTIFTNYVAPQTGLNSPGGHGNAPLDENDLNPKVDDTPGGIIYARTFLNVSGDVLYTLQLAFCDPPPREPSPTGFESEDVYQVEISVDPPILLNKHVRYWLDVQGVFPFNDNLRNTLQSWWMPSQRNTLYRGMTQRTGHPDYVVGGLPSWLPVNVDLVPSNGTTPPQRGNAGDPPPCANLPPSTRLDFAFQLVGVKDPVGIPNNQCTAVFSNPDNAFDGINPFDNTGATTDGPGSCTINQDIWFRYTATCTGLLTAETCDSSFDSAVAIYENLGCPVGPALDCDSASCGDDGRAQIVVAETGSYLIRVGGVSGAGGQGKGILHISCEETCGRDDGNPLVNNCCIDHSSTPPGVANLGCEIPLCCELVCATPGEETCCDNSVASGGWDSECAMVASEIPACKCPCVFTCPGGSTLETEFCGDNTNGGCDNLPNPETFESLGPLTFTVPKTACGKLRAVGGTRDTDWWKFSVPAGSGVATLTLTLSGDASVGVMILSTEDGDLPFSFCQTAGGDPATLRSLDSQATAGCILTDGSGSHPSPLVTCVAAPGTYAVFVSTFRAGEDGDLGEPIFDGLPCGGQDDYRFTLTATNNCTDGACCMFNGGCEDGSPGAFRNEHECFLAGGTFAGEGETCEALPPNVDCFDLTHGCVSAPTITCGQTIPVDLTIDNHLPEEGYPCGTKGNDPNDRAWLKFTAPCENDGAGPDCNDQPGTDTTSVRVNTCGSAKPGRDSLLGLYGSLCPGGGICPGTGNACSPGTFCGGACSAATPFAIAGCSDDDCGFSGFLSDICAENLIEGETYYIQVSNWAEPLNGIYQVSLNCPCTGSCCDSSNGVCQNGVNVASCGPPLDFDTEFTCSQLIPACGVGACCHANGTCTNTTAAGCVGANGVHHLGTQCSTILCNVYDSCDYSSGNPVSDRATFGFRSQYAADVGLFLEVADNFDLPGDPGTPCEISTIEYATFHSEHDTANGCLPGGDVSCLDTPDDYQGIIVTFSEDVAGNDKSPTCAPDCLLGVCTPGPDGDYHDEASISGCQSYLFDPAVVIPPGSGNYWQFTTDCSAQRSGDRPEATGQCEHLITLHFDPPLTVSENQKHWLAITHVLDQVGKYSVNWFASNHYDGNPTQFYNSLNEKAFVPIRTPPTELSLESTPHDMLFAIGGNVVAPGCGVCELFGDVAPLPAPKCLIDFCDLQCALDCFGFPGTPCADSLLGDIVTSGGACGPDGVCDADDLLAVLSAYGGVFSCPDPCPPGACVGDFTGPPPGSECRDGDQAGGFFVGNGMSESDCFNLTGGTGTYCGDYTVCDPDATCPGMPAPRGSVVEKSTRFIPQQAFTGPLPGLSVSSGPGSALAVTWSAVGGNTVDGNQVVELEAFVTNISTAPIGISGGQFDAPCSLPGMPGSSGTITAISGTTDPDGDGQAGPSSEGFPPYLFGSNGLGPYLSATCSIANLPGPGSGPVQLLVGEIRYVGTIRYEVSDCATGDFNIFFECTDQGGPGSACDNNPEATNTTRYYDGSVAGCSGNLISLTTVGKFVSVPVGACCDGTICTCDEVNEYCCTTAGAAGRPGICAAGSDWHEDRLCTDIFACACTTDSDCPGGYCDVPSGQCIPDCDGNHIADACDLDCDAPGCSGVGGCGQGLDCDQDGVLDHCESPQPLCPCTGDSQCHDNDICTCDRCNAVGICEHIPIAFGDTSCDCQGPDVSDILCVLDGFVDYSLCPNSDIVYADFTCGPDGLIDVSDVLAVIEAFVGVPPPRCGCGFCQGACCDGSSCTYTDFPGCQSPGIFFGPGSVCDDGMGSGLFGPSGACCYEDDGEPACDITFQNFCEDVAGGTFMGPCVRCSRVESACCQSGGSCTEETLADCFDLAGNWHLCETCPDGCP